MGRDPVSIPDSFSKAIVVGPYIVARARLDRRAEFFGRRHVKEARPRELREKLPFPFASFLRTLLRRHGKRRADEGKTRIVGKSEARDRTHRTPYENESAPMSHSVDGFGNVMGENPLEPRLFLDELSDLVMRLRPGCDRCQDRGFERSDSLLGSGDGLRVGSGNGLAHGEDDDSEITSSKDRATRGFRPRCRLFVASIPRTSHP